MTTRLGRIKPLLDWTISAIALFNASITLRALPDAIDAAKVSVVVKTLG
jgi:hypothetical protein